MMWVKIQIPDKQQSLKAFREMAQRGRIDCYLDNVYVVPEPALEFLAEIGVTYRELERGGRGWAEKMLRDTIAAHEQRQATDSRRSVRTDSKSVIDKIWRLINFSTGR